VDWVNDLVLPLISWTFQNGNFMCMMSKLALAENILTHCSDAICKEDFVVRLVRSVGVVLDSKCHIALASKVADLSNVSISSIGGIYYDINQKCIQQYSCNQPTDDEQRGGTFIETPDVKSVVEIAQSWLRSGDSFALIGPEGVGKLALVQHCFSKANIRNIITIYCSAQTKSIDVLRRLYSICMVSQTNYGKVLKPKNGGTLVIFLKDLNLPKPDK
jgi:dynein heavy chain 2